MGAPPTVQSNPGSLTGLSGNCAQCLRSMCRAAPRLPIWLLPGRLAWPPSSLCAICPTNRQPTTWPPLRARSKHCPICPLFVPCQPAWVTSSLTAHLHSHLPVLPRPTRLGLLSDLNVYDLTSAPCSIATLPASPRKRRRPSRSCLRLASSSVVPYHEPTSSCCSLVSSLEQRQTYAPSSPRPT